MLHSRKSIACTNILVFQSCDNVRGDLSSFPSKVWKNVGHHGEPKKKILGFE